MPVSTSHAAMFILILCSLTFQFGTYSYFYCVIHESCYEYLYIIIGLSRQNGSELRMSSSCTCLGQELTFECTVDGNGLAATYWQGSALQECPNQNRVIIRHSQHLTRQNTTEECGSTGTVVGTPVSSVNRSYTSRLTINVSQHLNGSTIECVSDGGRSFGSSKILLSNGKTYNIKYQ